MNYESISNVFLNTLLIVVWFSVVVLFYKQVLTYRKWSHTLVETPTMLKIDYVCGTHEGVITFYKDSNCFKPSVAPCKRGWKFVVPLNMNYDDFILFLEKAEPSNVYHTDDDTRFQTFKQIMLKGKSRDEIVGDSRLNNPKVLISRIKARAVLHRSIKRLMNNRRLNNVKLQDLVANSYNRIKSF